MWISIKIKLIAGLLAMIAVILAAIFLLAGATAAAAVPPLDSFRQVLAEETKTWFYSPSAVRAIRDGQTKEALTEIWARVDVPERKLRDVLQWHYSPKRNAYRALDAYTYDFSGRLVDQ